MSREVCEHYHIVGECYECEQAYQESLRKQPTLRDQFAMAALTGLVSVLAHQTNWHSGTAETMAGSAYGIADAMLAVRKEQP